MANLIFRNNNPFDQFFEEVFDMGKFKELGRIPAKQEGVEVIDAGNELLVHAEAPGFKRHEVEVSLEAGRFLRITGKQEEKKQGNKVFGQTRRSIDYTVLLPEGTSDEVLSADLEDGVLKVAFSKRKSTTKQIPLNSK